MSTVYNSLKPSFFNDIWDENELLNPFIGFLKKKIL